MKKSLLVILALILNFSFCFSQSLKLPYTWEMQNGPSIMRATLREDGSLVSEIIFACFNCQARGMCQVCQGTGGQFWYGIGMQACGACFGSGRCRGCGGKGYTVQSSSTQYGVTVIYDENGKMYVMGVGGAASDSRGNCSKRNKTEVIEYIDTYGVSANNNVYCSKCGKTMQRHVHVMK